jgi:polyisoprenoid-binding protein YceI
MERNGSVMWMLFVLLFLTGSVLAQTVEYHVDTRANNVVKFISSAPIEDFEGVTKRIDGYVLHQGTELTDNSDVYFEVDLRTLDTGIGLRNRHMREDYLHTDKFPFARYKGSIVRVQRSGRDNTVVVRGTMDIHGVTRQMDINATLTPTNNGYRVKSSFQVNLPDHDIPIPRFMFLKISEVMRLELDFHLKKVKG